MGKANHSNAEAIKACLEYLYDEARDGGLVMTAHLIGVAILELHDVLGNGVRQGDGSETRPDGENEDGLGSQPSWQRWKI